MGKNQNGVRPEKLSFLELEARSLLAIGSKVHFAAFPSMSARKKPQTTPQKEKKLAMFMMVGGDGLGLGETKPRQPCKGTSQLDAGIYQTTNKVFLAQQ